MKKKTTEDKLEKEIKFILTQVNSLILVFYNFFSIQTMPPTNPSSILYLCITTSLFDCIVTFTEKNLSWMQAYL